MPKPDSAVGDFPCVEMGCVADVFGGICCLHYQGQSE
jgi:hypothetical protein